MSSKYQVNIFKFFIYLVDFDQSIENGFGKNGTRSALALSSYWHIGRAAGEEQEVADKVQDTSAPPRRVLQGSNKWPTKCKPREPYGHCMRSSQCPRGCTERFLTQAHSQAGVTGTGRSSPHGGQSPSCTRYGTVNTLYGRRYDLLRILVFSHEFEQSGIQISRICEKSTKISCVIGFIFIYKYIYHSIYIYIYI